MNNESQFSRPKSGGKGKMSSSFPKDDSASSSDASSVVAGVKDLAAHAGDKLMDVAETEKKAGVDFAAGMAGAIRRAADQFVDDIPQAAQYIRGAADQVDYITKSLRDRNVGQLISDVEDFARRQPTAFLGATVIVGFLAMRFLKSSKAGTAPASPRRYYGNGRGW
jgi:hypothetical protein